MNSRCHCSARRQRKVRQTAATVSPVPSHALAGTSPARQTTVHRGAPPLRARHTIPRASCTPATPPLLHQPRHTPCRGDAARLRQNIRRVCQLRMSSNSGRVRLNTPDNSSKNFFSMLDLRQQPDCPRGTFACSWREKKRYRFVAQLLVCHSEPSSSCTARQHRKANRRYRLLRALLRDDAVNNFSMRRMPMRPRKLRGSEPIGIKWILPNRGQFQQKTSIVSPTSFRVARQLRIEQCFSTICSVISICLRGCRALLRCSTAHRAFAISTIVVPYRRDPRPMERRLRQPSLPQPKYSFCW